MTLSYSLSRQSKTTRPVSSVRYFFNRLKVGVQDATTYDRAEVIVSWEKQMERIFAPESLKHCLRSPSLHPSLSPFLSFFPSLLPPSLFLLLPSFLLSVIDSLSLCVLVPSQNNLGKSAQRIGLQRLAFHHHGMKVYWGKWRSGQGRDTLVSASVLPP